jgi:membrane-bound lytic murein transglycosylase D
MDTGAYIDQAVKSVKGVTEDERIASVLEAYRVQGFDSAITPEYIKYKDIIEPIMKEHGLDPSVYGMVPWQESGFNPNVCVPAAVDGKNETVKGMWQLTETTAREMGLKITSTGGNAKGEGLDSDLAVDERYDVEKSTRAAAKYLSRIKRDLGEHSNNDALVLCSYHTGPTAVKKMIKDLGSDYWSWEISDRNIKAYGFGSRSFDYVPRILAAAELAKS